jgi:hypothetical protein
MNTKLLTALSMALLFTACGSDSKSSSESVESQIKKKDFIVVVHNTPSEVCTLSRIKEGTNGRFLGTIATFKQAIDKSTMISKFESTNVSCEKYDRTNDTIICGIAYWDEATGKSCIIAFDYEK